MKNILLCALFFMASLSFAGVQYVEVEAEGSGINLGDAINSALVEAIGRINGKSIESASVMQSLQVEVSSNEGSDYFSSDAFAKQVVENTKGAVSGYEIISKNEGENGIWNVVLRTKIAKYEKSVGSDRKRIAIMPIRSGRPSFKFSGIDISDEEVTRVLSQSISNYLTQTRKFTVLDREYMDEASSELAIIGDATPVEEIARLGQKMVADYILVGTIEKINYSKLTKQMRTSTKEVTYGSGEVELGFKLIEVATQQVFVSDKATSTLQDEGRMDSRRALSTLSDKAAEKLSQIVMGQIYPIMVISVSGDEVVFNQGGNSLIKGERYKIYQYGEKMYDPYTKEYLGRRESPIGVVEITGGNAKQSYGRIVESSIDVAANFEDKKFIIREKIARQASSSAQKVQDLKENQKKNREQSDDNW